MARPRSVKRIVNKAVTADAVAREKIAKLTTDSFQDFQNSLGIGTESPLSSGNYGYNPVTKVRILLEWIHRGSWLGGVAVDLVADDMTRAGVDLKGELDPEDIEAMEEYATAFSVWNSINEALKWSRLYGGSIAVFLVDGQNLQTPFRVETVAKGQFKGLYVLDRWMVEPSLNDLVQEFGPDLGQPKYYTVTADAPALAGARIHHSRCIRLEGIRLPWWQRINENLWGLSVLERLYDRMIAFDSATTGAAQLTYKAFLRTLKLEGFRQAVASGGPALKAVVSSVQMMRRFQSNEGISIVDMKDELQVDGAGTSMTGIAEIIGRLGEQISGALQVPLVRLFGQSPAGLNSSGESDLRTYYDGIKQQQQKALKVGVTKTYRCIAQSLGIVLSAGFNIDFRSLWQLSEKEVSNVAKETMEAVGSALDAGLISPKIGAKELKQSSKVTGIFSNIDDVFIDGLEKEPPDLSELLPAPGQAGGNVTPLPKGKAAA